MQSNRTNRYLGPVICLLAALFYLYEFTLQVSPGAMTTELLRDMGLNAASLGFMSSLYYYAYTPMQIPAGLLHDRFGPRLTMTLAILACSLGAFCFASSHTIFSASIGRILMGAGSAFSFTGALVLISRWFPPRYFAILAGIVQLMSSIGAIVGEKPLVIAIHHTGWRNSMNYLAVGGLILALMVWLFVRNSPADSGDDRQPPAVIRKQTSRGKTWALRKIFSNPATYWTGAYSFLIWAPVTAFASLWDIPFLKTAGHLSTETASFACAAIWLGIGIGSPFCGWLSEYLQLRRTVLTACAAIGLLASLAVIYQPLPLPSLCLALFLLGIAGSGQSLAFCVVRDINQPDTTGAAMGLNNMATVAGGAILQPLIGLLLWAGWDGRMLQHVPVYSAEDYRHGLALIPICYLLATLISHFFISETHCRQVTDESVMAAPAPLPCQQEKPALQGGETGALP